MLTLAGCGQGDGQYVCWEFLCLFVFLLEPQLLEATHAVLCTSLHTQAVTGAFDRRTRRRFTSKKKKNRRLIPFDGLSWPFLLTADLRVHGQIDSRAIEISSRANDLLRLVILPR